MSSEKESPRAGRDSERRLGFALLGVLLAILGLYGPPALDRALREAFPPLPMPDTSTVVLDRNGTLLRAFPLPGGRWSLPVATAEVDPRYLALLVAAEDKRFREHAGVDGRALLRAAAQWAVHGRIVSGGSTLTMQVARLLEPRRARALGPKLRQIVRALALERRLDKDGVLDLYFRLAPYGGNLSGVRAASLAYFGHEPRRLSLAEAALMVALPQSPERRRPDRFPLAARQARARVLALAFARGLASADEVAAAEAEPVPHERRPLPALAPHAAEEAHAADPDARVIRLTLEASLQAGLEALVRSNAQRFGPAVSGALLVVDNASGEVRAHVGSADHRSAGRAGALDMTRAFRSPGSALKPFIYGLAFENGIAAPETILEDRPTHYGGYAPENFDQTFRGSVSAREALQLSLNLPAIALLDQVGPARFLARLRGAGVPVALPAEGEPGLAIGLGGLGVRLVDLARLYAGLARGGDVPNLIERADSPEPTGVAPPRSVADPVPAWLVGDILRGAPPPPNALGGRIAFKTGTSYGYRDALAIGFDRRYTVAAWIGRPDNGAVPGLIGRQAAAPVLFDAFARIGAPVEPPAVPPDLRAEMPGALVPPPLRHLRDRGGAVVPRLKIAYPPDGATVELDPGAELSLKVEGGTPPFTWFVNGVPAAPAAARRQASWAPDGQGFARLSVTDAAGHADSASIRLR